MGSKPMVMQKKYTWSTYKKAENTWAYKWGSVTPTNGDSGVYGPLQN